MNIDTPAGVAQPLLYSIIEAGRLLGLGRSSVYELINSQQLIAVSCGRRRLIPATELRRFVNDLQANPDT